MTDSETGTQRMYGLGRALAAFYDALPPGTIITAEVQRQAQEHALAWLRARMPGLVETPQSPAETPENTPRAANG